MKLTEEQIEEYSKGWNIRVNQVVATRFLKDLETDEYTYIQALQYIHGLCVSVETTIALEYILKKLYKPKVGSKGECGQWPKIPMAVDQFLMKQRGEVIGY